MQFGIIPDYPLKNVDICKEWEKFKVIWYFKDGYLRRKQGNSKGIAARAGALATTAVERGEAETGEGAAAETGEEGAAST